MSAFADALRKAAEAYDAEHNPPASGSGANTNTALPPNTIASTDNSGQPGTIGLSALTLTLKTKTPDVFLTAVASDMSPVHFVSNDPSLFTIQDPNEYGSGNATLATLTEAGHGSIAVSTDSGLSALIDVTVTL